MEGSPVTNAEWMAVLDYVNQQSGIKYIIASGSLPPGVPVDFFARLATIAKKKNARLIADTSGEALKEVVAVGLFMIKPNQGELSSLYGEEDLSAESLVTAARSIIKDHGTEAIVISLGAEGAMLVTATEQVQVKPPAVTVQSTVGAGDSMVAGMVWALSQNWDWPAVLCYGVAAGTAATLNRGTELCKKADTDQIFAQMKQE
jgi:6-phosphofructokinase 2